MIDWTYFSVNNVPAADALDLKEKNRLALEQLDLQIQKLLADTSVLIDKSRGGYVKIQILDHLNKPFSHSSSMSLQEVANFFQVSKKTISIRLADGMPWLYQNKTFYIKKLITDSKVNLLLVKLIHLMSK